MNRLRQLISRIGAQLKNLDVSQRIAIALCAALVATSLMWLLQWSTQPDLVPLVDRQFSADELNAAEDALSAEGIPFSIRRSRIYVNAADQPNVVRILSRSGALPEGSLFDMEQLVSDSNPFLPPEELAMRQNYAKGNFLAQTIATSPFVRDARVMISPRTRRRLNGASDVPTAMVHVTLTSGEEMTRPRVQGIAQLVSGAVQGLKSYNVNIIDATSGRSYSVPHPDDASSDAYLEAVKAHEKYLQQKILDQLAYIPGVVTSVAVELDSDVRSTVTTKYAEPAVKSAKTTESEESAGRGPSEAGLAANNALAVGVAGQGQTNTTGETDEQFFEPSVTEQQTIRGTPLVPKYVTATVSIPRSFVVSIYTAKNPGATDPSDTDLAVEKEELVASVKGSVERIVQAKSAADVEVGIYPDMGFGPDGPTWSPMPRPVGMGVAAAPGRSVMELARGYGPQLGLGLLAVMSLMMMTRIVRKSADELNASQDVEDEEEEDDYSDRILSVGPQTVGEAEMTEGLLAGTEIDESTLRDQQVVGEVSKMVDENPVVAANLVRKWIEDAN